MIIQRHSAKELFCKHWDVTKISGLKLSLIQNINDPDCEVFWTIRSWSWMNQLDEISVTFQNCFCKIVQQIVQQRTLPIVMANAFRIYVSGLVRPYASLWRIRQIVKMAFHVQLFGASVNGGNLQVHLIIIPCEYPLPMSDTAHGRICCTCFYFREFEYHRYYS